MNYEKKYKEALERAKNLHKDAINMGENIRAKQCEIIFPELKESEDEKIRKELVQYLNDYPNLPNGHYCRDDFFAWLEKQGEQNPYSGVSFKYNGHTWGMCARDNGVDILLDKQLFKHLDTQNEQKPIFNADDWYVSKVDGQIHNIKLENQSEQKLADKIEPKFHERDWVIYNNDICQIVKREEGCNILVTQFGVEKEPVNERNLSTAKLWGISDARDGDVLFHSDSASNGIFIFKEIIDKGFAKEVICYCDYDSEDHFCLDEYHTCCWTDAKILYPATKEQRDTLFAKMKEAGYTFDFKKKELKKLGQPEVTKTSDQEEIAEIPFGAKDSELQEAIYYIPKGFHAEIDDDKVVIKKDEKSTVWSEEDERNMQNIDSVLFYDKKLPEDTCVKLRNFLRTLKQRCI